MRAERKRYDNGIKGSIAKYFQMKNSENDAFLIEICGGITMYFVSLYIVSYNQFAQGGLLSDANGLNGQFTEAQYKALPAAAALCAGLSTILMGVIGNMP